MRSSTYPHSRDAGLLGLYAWVMLVTAGVVVAVALAATRTDPQYSASAEILVDPTITPSGNYIQPSMPTEQRVATSAEVVGAVATELGVTPERALRQLSVTVPVDTQVLVMTYTGDSPAAALSGAEAVAQTYLDHRNPADGENAVASLVGPPELPTTAISTSYPLVLGAAVLGGLLTGFVVAWTWDRLRGRIRTVADAERHTDLHALAVPPPGPRPGRGGERWMPAGRCDLDSLAARLLVQVPDVSRHSVLVTGAGARCGSTAVAVHTAVALARMGREVVLVTADEDVRASTLARDEAGLQVVPVPGWNRGAMDAATLTALRDDHGAEALVVVDGPSAWHGAALALQVDTIVLVTQLGRTSRSAAAAAVQALDHCSEKVLGLVVTPRRSWVRAVPAAARPAMAARVSGIRWWFARRRSLQPDVAAGALDPAIAVPRVDLTAPPTRSSS